MRDDSEPNPTAARRTLSIRLRELRMQAGRDLTELASFVGVSEAQASRLDTGARGFRPPDVRKLAEWYGVGTDERDRLVQLAAESRRRGWWQQVDLADSYRTLIGMEQAARSIHEYCSSVVPGLLQTRDYAYAAVRGSSLNLTAAQIEQAVEVRMRRQWILRRSRPPELRVVVDEAVLARVTGGPEVMGAQLRHLITAGEDLHVTVQVIGFELGMHPGVESHFITVGASDEASDIVYAEGLLGLFEVDAKDSVSRYRDVWNHLRGVALDPVASRARLERYVAVLRG